MVLEKEVLEEIIDKLDTIEERLKDLEKRSHSKSASDIFVGPVNMDELTTDEILTRLMNYGK